MNEEKIKTEINKFLESKITKIEFKMLDNIIRFELKVFYNNKFNFHLLEFKNVSSYYFMNNFSNRRKEFLISDEPDDYLELTSFEFINDENAIIYLQTTKEWSNNKFNSVPQFAIEIWNRFLFIEAEFIIIDSKEYKI